MKKSKEQQQKEIEALLTVNNYQVIDGKFIWPKEEE